MKKLSFLRIYLVFVFVLAFCCVQVVCWAAGLLSEHLTTALKLRETGDIEGATRAIQRALLIMDTVDSLEEGSQLARTNEDILYTKKFIQTLLECLKADEVTYSLIIRQVGSVLEKTRDLFKEMADELKSGTISLQGPSRIKEIRGDISRVMVTHTFCVPPKEYKQIYDVTQNGLYRYSKAWENLYLISLGKTDEKTRLQAEALLNFQMGNELFSQAGTLMMAISKK